MNYFDVAIREGKNPKGRSDFTFSQVKSLLFNSNSFFVQELNISELGYR